MPPTPEEIAQQRRDELAAQGVTFLSRGTAEERREPIITLLAEALEKGMDEATTKWGAERAGEALLELARRISEGEVE